MGSFSIWHWLIVLLVVVLIFGTKKLRNMGSDVGGAVKNFKDAMGDEKANPATADKTTQNLNTIKSDTTQLIEAEVVEVPAPKAAPKKKVAAKKPAVAKPKTAAAKKPVAKPKAATAAKAK